MSEAGKRLIASANDALDLVKRLRWLASLNRSEFGGPYQGYAASDCVRSMIEAADRIEQLERELSEAREQTRCDIFELTLVNEKLAAEKALADRLRGEVCGLWMLLDDIDTLDDACKDNDAVFRKRCYDKQRSRFNIVSGEAYDDYRKARWL